MKKKIFKKELLEELWCKQQLSVETIAEMLKTSPKTVKKNILEQNISRDLKNYMDKNWLYEKHYVAKLNCKEMAKLADCTSVTIQKWMKYHKIEVSKEITNLSKRKYNENVHFFDKIDTEEKAYWIGFLMADGNINRSIVTIRLARKDRNHLQKFLDSLSSNRNIFDYETELDNKLHPMSRVDLASFIAVEKLKALGFTSNKSLKEVFPNIPTHLNKHFIRGYFDGDGCFTYGIAKNNKQFLSVSIVSGETILNSIKKIVDKENILCNVYQKSGDLYMLMFHHNQALSFLNFLYTDSTIFLDRKYEKYMNYITSKDIV